MRKFLGITLIILALLITFSAESQATTNSDDITFKSGGALRLRHEFWKNWADYNSQNKDNRNFFRVKTSLWGQANFGDDLMGYLKLTNEFKAYSYFGGAASGNPDKFPDKKGYHFMIDEVIVDNLYLDVKGAFDLPVDLRVGRQDFLGMYGEGFLIMDGTPGDGSRTFFFNAAKASWKVDEYNTVDFIGIINPKDDDFLPVLNRDEYQPYNKQTADKVPYMLNTTDETGFVAYWKTKAFKNLAWELYYMNKKEDDENGAGYQARKTKLDTIGSFAKYKLDPFTLRGQFAWQRGKYGIDDRKGMGGYGWIDHDFKDAKWAPQLSAGYVYLSGDKQSTATMEGWDPLFSRFPLWSELYLLSMARETSIVGYWTNLSMPGVQLKFKPTEKMKLMLAYYYLRANELPAAGTYISGTSKNRGQLPQFRVDYAFSKDITGYFLVEYLKPGKFYVERDSGLFTRTEIQFKF